MDESVLFNGVLRALLGGRRRRGRRAMGYVASAGSTLLSHPTALLGAAGLAWGIFETLQGNAQGQRSAGPDTSDSGFGAAAAGTTGAVLPVPVAGETGAPMTDATRMVRLAISAAQADGALGAEERATVLARAEEAGLAELLERELHAPRPLADIVAGVTDAGQRATLYTLAFAVVRADEQVGGAERIYLAQLAHLLGLDPAAVQRLESAAESKIDAAPES
jgi:uncharacterized membrane protein YebE (DUF533 family)